MVQKGRKGRNAADLTAAHAQVAIALAQKRRLIVINTGELEAIVDTDALVLLIKTKLCDLHVKGIIG